MAGAPVAPASCRAEVGRRAVVEGCGDDRQSVGQQVILARIKHSEAQWSSYVQPQIGLLQTSQGKMHVM
jgi:hypothetical protein